ncbi:5-formyltetrahydrofolate cyclo-ligase [Sediminibacillus massiliensis]|uniref:5-formyltetrahydrofolate cyclo-ligase n=1 Tax=Sediminibacillus massiliensis TaxID=1926277 RepID=UPI0009885D12|nr:5-formyltetrahydrofolate cyclo-ligase [Sediminibacillus massiliensis]
MDKKILRKQAKRKLENFSVEKRKKVEERLFFHLIHSTFWTSSRSVAVTVSQRHEWDTKLIIEQAWKENKTVCVPKCFPNIPEIVFYRLESYDQLECVYMDLLEPIPEQKKEMGKDFIDLLIVPGLLFDQEGYRVGYGGGYYDRYIQDFPNVTLSITSSEQLMTRVPKESHDIPVQHIITEKGLFF